MFSIYWKNFISNEQVCTCTTCVCVCMGESLLYDIVKEVNFLWAARVCVCVCLFLFRTRDDFVYIWVEYDDDVPPPPPPPSRISRIENICLKGYMNFKFSFKIIEHISLFKYILRKCVLLGDGWLSFAVQCASFINIYTRHILANKYVCVQSAETLPCSQHVFM